MGYFNSEELFHSETYLGADYSNGLKHYKYIRRYRNGKGKWTYVYGNKDTHQKIRSNLLKAQVASNTYKRNIENAHMHERGAWMNDVVDDEFPEITNAFRIKHLKEETRNRGEAITNKNLVNVYDTKAFKDISENSIKNLSKKKVEKGIAAISNVFSKLKKKG